MKTNLSGKLTLITGASRGIGAEVAKSFAAAGAHVVLVARTVGGLEEVDDAIRAAGGQATLLPLDLLKHNEIDRVGPTIAERFGKLDILIANAGMLGTLTPLPHMKAHEWDRVMALNVTANFRLIRTLDPLLRAAPAGRAVFVTSGMAQRCTAYWGAYATSKAALEAMVKTYAAETAETNLRVNLLSPGPIDTAMLREAYPGGYQGETRKPEEIMGAFFALADADCARHGEVVRAAEGLETTNGHE
jgi:NAD(P)-dependent dehydrogenase (short-subunit alcohol dehydrogenase family)